MGFWKITIGPLRQRHSDSLSAALKVIVEEAESYRVPSKIMIARYSQEKRRNHSTEIDALEEIVAAHHAEIESQSVRLRELAEPLMSQPPSGPSFLEFLKGSLLPRGAARDGQHTSAKEANNV